jgi:hypothetical protein
MKLRYLNRVADANNSNGGNQANANQAKAAPAKAATASDDLLNADKADGAKTNEPPAGTNKLTEINPGPDGPTPGPTSGTENQGTAQTDQQQKAAGGDQPGAAAVQGEKTNEESGNQANANQANQPSAKDENAEQDEVLNKVAEKIAGHLQNAGIGAQVANANKPAGPRILSDDQKLAKYGPGYIDAKNERGATTTFSAKVWASLGKNKLGWVPVVKTPPEVDALNKTN